MSTVIHKLNAALKIVNRVIQEEAPALGLGPVKPALSIAKAYIEHLEARLAATETMRDRVAMQFLPGIMQDCTGMAPGKGLPLIRVAYRLADEVLLVRVEEPAGLAGEQALSPEEEGARLFRSGCGFSSIFGDVDERFVNDMPAMERVAAGYRAAGVPTSPDFSTREYKIGDKFRLADGVATITDVFIDDKGVRFYDFASKARGYEGNFTAADIAAHQATYGQVLTSA